MLDKNNINDEPKRLPADIKFVNTKTDASPTATLRLKRIESYEDGIKRLSEMGWSVSETKHIQSGRFLRAVGKRIKGLTRNLIVGSFYTFEYYDILEASDVESLETGNKTWSKDLEYVKTSGTIVIGKTDKNTFFGFPIGIIANVTLLDKVAEPEEVVDPVDTTSTVDDEKSEPIETTEA